MIILNICWEMAAPFSCNSSLPSGHKWIFHHLLVLIFANEQWVLTARQSQTNMCLLEEQGRSRLVFSRKIQHSQTQFSYLFCHRSTNPQQLDPSGTIQSCASSDKTVPFTWMEPDCTAHSCGRWGPTSSANKPTVPQSTEEAQTTLIRVSIKKRKKDHSNTKKGGSPNFLTSLWIRAFQKRYREEQGGRIEDKEAEQLPLRHNLSEWSLSSIPLITTWAHCILLLELSPPLPPLLLPLHLALCQWSSASLPFLSLIPPLLLPASRRRRRGTLAV